MRHVPLPALLLPATVLAQVSVAPLFPVAGAVVELPVILLLLLAIFAGPLPVMIGLPVLVLLLGFAANVEFEWLVVAYLPLLPATAWLQRRRAIPQIPYLLILVAAILAGVWARAVFAAVAMASGASPDFAALLTDVLVPGVALDAAVLSAAWLACRSLGWEARSLNLERAGL